MKVIRTGTAGLQCPFCGSKKVHLKKNASKDFQIECTQCGAHGGWYTKPQAIINWYNMGIQYWKNQGYLNLPFTPKKG